MTQQEALDAIAGLRAEVRTAQDLLRAGQLTKPEAKARAVLARTTISAIQFRIVAAIILQRAGA